MNLLLIIYVILIFNHSYSLSNYSYSLSIQHKQIITEHYSCNQTIIIPSIQGQLFNLQIPYIKPYIQTKKICLIYLVNQSNQYFNSSNQYFNQSNQYFNQSNQQQVQQQNQQQVQQWNKQDNLYYLRVDSMPNQCINVKNDIQFTLINILSINQSLLNKQQYLLHKQQSHQNKQQSLQNKYQFKDTKLYIAQVVIYKQCANIKYDQQNSLIKLNTNLVIQIKKVIINLFGFPIYQHPFKKLSLFIILLIVTFIAIQLFSSTNKHKSY